MEISSLTLKIRHLLSRSAYFKDFPSKLTAYEFDFQTFSDIYLIYSSLEEGGGDRFVTDRQGKLNK